jgi:predicted ABC-type ATPase
VTNYCLHGNIIDIVHCRLIINDCLDSGTQLPYIKWARENGYAVIVANTNLNTGDIPNNRRKKPIPIKVGLKLFIFNRNI